MDAKTSSKTISPPKKELYYPAYDPHPIHPNILKGNTKGIPSEFLPKTQSSTASNTNTGSSKQFAGFGLSSPITGSSNTNTSSKQFAGFGLNSPTPITGSNPMFGGQNSSLFSPSNNPFSSNSNKPFVFGSKQTEQENDKKPEKYSRSNNYSNCAEVSMSSPSLLKIPEKSKKNSVNIGNIYYYTFGFLVLLLAFVLVIDYYNIDIKTYANFNGNYNMSSIQNDTLNALSSLYNNYNGNNNNTMNSTDTN